MKNITHLHRLFTMFTVMLLLFVNSPTITAQGEYEGPNNPRTAVNDTGGGTVAWSDPENITTPGEPYATIRFSPQNGQISNSLRGTNYGFSIPSDATILGITVNINRFVKTTPSLITDYEVYLLKDYSPVGQNKADTAEYWPGIFTTATYGGSTDLWGTEWTAEQINNPGFGASLAVIKPSNGNRDATVDTMQITVNYTVGSSTTIDCGDGNPITEYGSSITCTAVVTRASGNSTPGGTITWSTGGSGTFDPNPCTLTGIGETSSCSASYIPEAVGSGPSDYRNIQWRYCFCQQQWIAGSDRNSA